MDPQGARWGSMANVRVDACMVCGEPVAGEDAVRHVLAAHPERCEALEGWPTGLVLVVDTAP